MMPLALVLRVVEQCGDRIDRRQGHAYAVSASFQYATEFCFSAA